MGTFRSLRHRNYRLYFFGQLVSLVGTWMQSAALAWLAYDLTGQSRWPAFVAAAQVGPTLLLGPWAGALADRTSKHRLILTTQAAFCAAAFALAALVLSGAAGPAGLLAAMLAVGLVQAVDVPARLAFVPDLVGRDDLINAVALNSLLFNSARAVGPALAGLVIDAAGAGVCVLVNAVSYLAVLAALARMDLPPDAPGARAAAAALRSPGGFRVVAARPALARLVALAGVMSLAAWPLLTLLPAYARTVLGGGSRDYGWLLSSVGVGALASALAVATYGRESRRRAFLAGGAALAAAGLAVVARADTLAAAAAGCGLFGFGVVTFLSTGQAALQLAADGATRGRVMGVWAMVLAGGVPLGNLIAGPLADAAGVTAVLAGQAAVVAGVAAAAALAGRAARTPP